TPPSSGNWRWRRRPTSTGRRWGYSGCSRWRGRWSRPTPCSPTPTCATRSPTPAGITSWRSRTTRGRSTGTFGRCSRGMGRPFPPYQRRLWREGLQGVTTTNMGHGRVEKRTVTTSTWLNEYHRAWPKLAQVVRVERERRITGEATVEVSYYITSLGRGRADAARLGQLIRSHWEVEIPQPDDRRSDNLCDPRRAGYHLGRGPAGVGRVVRPTPGSWRSFMSGTEPLAALPRR